MNTKKILLPTDFYDHSRTAHQCAVSIARDHQAEITAVHVLHNSPSVADALGPLIRDEDTAQIERMLLEIQSADDRVPVQIRMLTGNPAAEVIRLARQESFDLVVMGTHGRTGLSRVALGSVAEQVVRVAPCPVLTVRANLPAAVPSS